MGAGNDLSSRRSCAVDSIGFDATCNNAVGSFAAANVRTVTMPHHPYVVDARRQSSKHINEIILDFV